MKKYFLLFVIFYSAFISYAQKNDLEDTLGKFRESFIQSMKDGNESALRYASPEIRLMPEFQMTVMNITNVGKYYHAFHQRFDVTQYTRKESEIQDLGAFVMEWGQFTMSITNRETKVKKDLPGKYMDIWHKDEPGKLTLVTQAWNYNHQIDFGDQLRFDDVPSINVALAAHAPVNNSVSFELAAMNKLMETIVTQHDASRWKMFYSDDGNFLYSNNPAYQGRSALDAFLDAHVRDLAVFEVLDIRNDHIDDLGMYVIEYASHTAFVRGNDWSGAGTGKDLRIWRREKNGSLKIYRHIGMYD